MKPIIYQFKDLLKDSDLTPNQRHLVRVLIDYMDENGQSCYPSQETLSKEMGCNEKTVRRALKVLESKKWIKISKAHYQNQQWQRNKYEINRHHLHSNVVQISTKRRDTMSTTVQKPRSQCPKGPDINVQKVRSQCPTNTSLNTSLINKEKKRRAKKIAELSKFETKRLEDYIISQRRGSPETMTRDQMIFSLASTNII